MLAVLIVAVAASGQEPAGVVPAGVTMPRTPVDAAKIRKAIHLPREGYQLRAESDGEGHIRLADPRSTPAREIEQLRRQLTGGPDDAKRYEELNGLFEKLKKDEEAKECSKKALDLRRKVCHEKPTDALARKDYGYALLLNGDLVGAENEVRRAVELGPNDWSCWTELGFVLLEKADKELYQELDRFGNDLRWEMTSDGKSCQVFFGPNSTVHSVEELFRALDEKPVSDQRIVRAERLLSEASSCYERAVSLAPREPGPYEARSELLSRRSELRGTIALFRKDLATAGQHFLNQILGSLPDKIQEARCLPDEPAAILAEGLCEIMRRTFERLKDGADSPVNPAVIEDWIKSAEERLDAIAGKSDRKIACRACVVKSYLMQMRRDQSAAETAGRRAVELDSGSELAWIMLTQSIPHNALDRLAICETNVRRFDCRFNRTHLAAAYAAAGRLDEAETQIRHTLKDDPDDIVAQLQLAGLFLLRDTPDATAKANDALTTAERLVAADPKHERRGQAAALRAVYCALTGNPMTARIVLQAVSK
jgi:tetratricopeptide (TPR) repeat protein